MHRTGIAPRGEESACRWLAVRYDEVSIHVVAVLARQDGAPARTPNDFRRVRETCLAALLSRVRHRSSVWPSPLQ